MSEAIEPFQIRVPQDVLDDLHQRLERSRFPDQPENAGWDYGAELSTVRELCAYWRHKFDWRAQEAALNRWPQFRTGIEGLGLHFLHVRSPVEEALPLVITHGWPGSVSEFVKILGPLTDPVAHGGEPGDAFHVVCPSLPGFGFSDRPSRSGWNVRRCAEAIAKMMGRLGYTCYGAQGGDWGSYVTHDLALVDREHVCGIHLNMVMVPPPPGGDPMAALSEKEKELVLRAMQRQADETAYLQIQRAKPQTLGYGLNDSPAGLAAWIVEKFHGWSDCDGEVERRFTKDELLTNITIYWVTQTIASSLRFYRESLRQGVGGLLGEERVERPTGCSISPGELYVAPRAWVEHYYNVTRWTEQPSGGHFAALEEPERLVDDVRAFFRTLR